MAMTAFETLSSAIKLHYWAVPGPLADLVRMSLPASLIAWAVFAICAAGVPFTVKSTRAQIIGFGIAIIGALLICVSSTSSALTAKRALPALQQQIAEIDAKTRDHTLSAEQRTSLAEDRAEFEQQVEKQEALIDLASLMTNFAAMTLGGFGAGLLTAVATTTRTREEEEALDAPVFANILLGLRYCFCGVIGSSILTTVALLIAAGMGWISTQPYQSGYIVACFSLMVAAVLAQIGYCLAVVQSAPRPRPLGSVVLGLIAAYLYVMGISLAADFLGGWVWLNVVVVLLFGNVRQCLRLQRSVA
ncbi:putative membrane protein [Pseudomonas reidholzensis]|uniref:Putative membrane protein n=1 Tax=Pseudomonas reidholzensis TaxID=1785162 RepID=A0A383RSH1_9PSED|nr:putative membrane protein [Pseudomonas reidholzensis]